MLEPVICSNRKNREAHFLIGKAEGLIQSPLLPAPKEAIRELIDITKLFNP